MKSKGSITDVPGLKVGHAQNFEAITGCTVIIFESEATGGVDIRGGGTSTRQIDPLELYHFYGRIHAVLLTGGSAYGLDAAGGVMKYLEEQGRGLDVSYRVRIPSVPTAVVFDLGIGNPRVRPDSQMGYKACLGASTKPVEEGSVGAGTGATVGKLLEVPRATKGGVGSASYRTKSGATIGALVVVNAFGDVVDPETGRILAGVRNSPKGKEFLSSVKLYKEGTFRKPSVPQSTTLAVIATDAKLSRSEATRVARMAQSGIVKAIFPAHTTFDGDLVFALSCGDVEEDVNTVGVVAVEVLVEAIMRAVRAAKSLGGILAWSDIFN